MAVEASPEQMQEFLVEFARNDPDQKAREVFLKLINLMRGKSTFEGYYTVYMLIQDSEDARRASQLARTDAHRAMMENLAVASLADKNRLVDFQFRLKPSVTVNSEGSCVFFCRYNFTALRQLGGELSLKLQSGSLIKLRLGTYKVTLSAQVSVARRKIQVSSWLGNYDGPDNFSDTQEITVTLAPPNYSAQQSIQLQNLPVAFFQRGSAGGYTGIYATGNGDVQLQLKSVELIK